MSVVQLIGTTKSENANGRNSLFINNDVLEQLRQLGDVPLATISTRVVESFNMLIFYYLDCFQRRYSSMMVRIFL